MGGATQAPMANNLRPSKSRMTAGRILYWSATIVAGLIVIFAVADFFFSWEQGTPILRIVAFIVAAGVWLIGLICLLAVP